MRNWYQNIIFKLRNSFRGLRNIFCTIFFYQLFLTIFFFSSTHFILLLIIVFIAGILAHIIYIKIKKYLKEDIKEKEEDNTDNKNERE